MIGVLDCSWVASRLCFDCGLFFVLDLGLCLMCIRFALLCGCDVHWYYVRVVMFDNREFVFLD